MLAGGKAALALRRHSRYRERIEGQACQIGKAMLIVLPISHHHPECYDPDLPRDPGPTGFKIGEVWRTRDVQNRKWAQWRNAAMPAKAP
jgi:hypothetical protein